MRDRLQPGIAVVGAEGAHAGEGQDMDLEADGAVWAARGHHAGGDAPAVGAHDARRRALIAAEVAQAPPAHVDERDGDHPGLPPCACPPCLTPASAIAPPCPPPA